MKDLYLKHVVNFENEGIFSNTGEAKSTLTQIEEIFNTHIPSSNRKNIVVHIHGGLNSESIGLSKLTDEYSIGQKYLNTDEIYPIHIVWESGFLDALKQLSKKAETKKKLIFKIAKMLGKSQLSWFKSNKSISRISDLDSLDLDLSLSNTFLLEPGEVNDNIKASFSEDDIDDLLGEDKGYILAQLNDKYPNDSRQKGFFSSYAFLKAVAFISYRIFKRNNEELQWNGFKNTLVEEIIREFDFIEETADKMWSIMKTNANTTFDEGHDGEQFLNILRDFMLSNNNYSLNIVAHSAGSFHANQIIQKLSTQLDVSSNIHFKSVIYLAPACSLNDFEQTVIPNKNNIETFKLFVLKDSIEKKSKMIPLLYDGSLLYMLSGLLEDTVGYLNLGLERVIESSNNQYIKDNTILSVTENCTYGNCSHSKKHGDFDEDISTQNSIIYLVSN